VLEERLFRAAVYYLKYSQLSPCQISFLPVRDSCIFSQLIGRSTRLVRQLRHDNNQLRMVQTAGPKAV